MSHVGLKTPLTGDYSMSSLLQDGVFQCGFALLLTHELDAVMQKEWRLLYVLRHLSEETAAPAFVALHVPLTLMLLWFIYHRSSSLQQLSRLAIAVFMVVHAGLHYRLTEHPLYTFHSPLSKALIYGAGLSGAVYCLLRLVPAWRKNSDEADMS